MKISFEVNAEPRNDQGKGASRRLRHAGKVPAILYGGHAEPRSLALEHEKLRLVIGDERFYSSIISINVGAEKQPAIVKDVQMHPAKNAVVHIDLQRVLENEKIRLHLPIHFKNESIAPGVKTQGGVVSHHNLAVVSIHSPRAAEPEPTAEAATAEAAAAVPAAAGEAKKEEGKKEEPKKEEAKKEGGKK
jgi:large subunit ribosomal protein L25